jgi:hypothetical protein
MKSEVYKTKVETRDEALARILDATAHKNKCEDQLRQQHAIFAHELQTALHLTVEFVNAHFESNKIVFSTLI